MADGSDDEQVELSQDQEVATPDMDIGGETEDSSHLLGLHPGLNTPPPLTPVSRPTPGKRCDMGQRKILLEEKLLDIIQKPESKPDEEELFCLSLAAKLRENQRSLCTDATAANTVQIVCMVMPLSHKTATALSHNNCHNKCHNKWHNNFLHKWPINKVLLHQAYKVIIIP